MLKKPISPVLLALTVIWSTVFLIGCAPQPQPPPRVLPATPVTAPVVKEDSVLIGLLKAQSEALNLKSGLQKTQAELEQSIAKKTAALEAYREEVKAYLAEHPEATAAILAGVGGAAVATDDDSEVSEDAKTVAAGVAVIAGIYAITHAEECAEVAQVMVESDNTRKATQREIESFQKRLDAVNQELQAVDDRLLQIDRDISARKSSTFNSLY